MSRRNTCKIRKIKPRKTLIKEFERRGLPWKYDGKEVPELHELVERPEMEDRVKQRLIRIEEIKENLLKNEEQVYAYRKEMIHRRKYGKFSKVVDELFPSWIRVLKDKNSSSARED